MKYLLVTIYALFFYLCSLDLFRSADFMVTIFVTSTACLLCALIAKHVDSLFAELFILLQTVALINYASMAMSYVWFDASLMIYLENINNALLITDILTLLGVMLGDRWLYNRFS